jgi:hypothetical protein
MREDCGPDELMMLTLDSASARVRLCQMAFSDSRLGTSGTP